MWIGKTCIETCKSSPPVTTSTSITETVNSSHQFRITGYSLLKGVGIGKYIAYDTFMVGGYAWAIYFYPDGKSMDDNGAYLSLFITLVSDGKDVRALFELTLMDQSGKNTHMVHSHFGWRALHTQVSREHVVQATLVKRLCKTHNIITVNGQYPRPNLELTNGDTLVVKVVNKARYNVTIHWHGIRQMRTGWADGSEFVTQCPIHPGQSYTYRFTVDGQEGTLWWHTRSSCLRATVYGTLIIYPKQSAPYPFSKPKRETPVLLSQWWDAYPIDVINEAKRTGASPNISDAYTINSQPGDLYKCSSKDTVVIPVDSGETILL